MPNILTFYIFIFLFSMDTSILEEIDNPLNIEILLSAPEYLKTGKKGTIVFPGRCHFDSNNYFIDTSKKTYFNKEILDIYNKSYNVECGPWFDHDFFTPNCYIFCNFNESIPKGNYTISFNDNFTYSNNEANYSIKVYFFDAFNIEKEDYDIIDLYSDIQNINISDNQEIYDLKFKINVYNNERLFYGISNLSPANCKVDNNELLCTINKSILEKKVGILHIIRLYSLDEDGNTKFFNLVPDIIVNYDNIEKKDIYIELTNLLTDFTSMDSYIVYETNVTDIPNINIFALFLDFDGVFISLGCSLIKGENNPLIVVCTMTDDSWVPDKIWLPITDEEEIFNQSSILYNFRIQPIKKEMIIPFKNYSYSYIAGIYPETLDFESNESIQIEILTKSPFKIKGLTFNEEKNDLECEDLPNVKICTVKKDHFKGKDSGYFFLKHEGYNNTKKISYEVTPIKVILPKNDKENENEDEKENENKNKNENNNDNDNENDNSNKNKVVLIISIIVLVIVIVIAIVIIVFVFHKKKTDLEKEVMKTSFKYDE